jgi:hypothetical protein
VKLLESVIVDELLIAIITRLLVVSVLTAETIQRPDSRSYSTPGSVTSAPLLTELQKTASVTLSAPRFPCLSNTLIRPLTSTSTCVGLTDPIESGGMYPDSLTWAPRKEVPAIKELLGPSASLTPRCGGWGTAGPGSFGAVRSLSGSGFSRTPRGFPARRRSSARWRAARVATLTRTPGAPAHG